MAKLRIGLVGCGQMGSNHARVLGTIPDVELVGVYDERRPAAVAVAETTKARIFLSLHNLADACDGIIVASPTSTHRDVVLGCSGGGVRAFLVEKPVVAEACEVRDLTVPVAVGHIERFNPAYEAFRKICAVEKPYHYAVERLSPWTERSQDVSVVVDMMVHDLDLLLDLHDGESPDEARSCGATAKSPTLDHVSALLGWPDGTFATATASKAAQNKVRRIVATGNNAVIEADLLRRQVTVYRSASSLPYEYGGVRQDGSTTTISVPPREPLREELLDFCAMVRDGTAPRVGLRAGVAALELAWRIERAAKGE